MSDHQAAIWRGYGGERDRWAVYSRASRTFYFPARHGQAAAERLARRMNKES